LQQQQQQKQQQQHKQQFTQVPAYAGSDVHAYAL
jgi:hypothetical protein